MLEEVENKWFWWKLWISIIFLILLIDYVNGLGKVHTYRAVKVDACKHYSLVRYSLNAAIVDVENVGKVRMYTKDCEEGRIISIQQRTGFLLRNEIFEPIENI